MKKTISTSIVGLQYYGITVEIIGRINEGEKISLKEEPENPHDKNAVAVYIGSVKIGHIRASEAKQVCTAIKAHTTITVQPCDKSILRGSTYFSANVVIEKNIPHLSHPIIAKPNTAGIYRIYSASTGSFYIGQSIDVNNRIKQHWDSLRLGVHTNSALQQLWTQYGESEFIADVVATAPDDLGSADRQFWLADSEVFYISQGKKYGECLNKYSGGLVLTQELRNLEDESDRHNRLINNDAIRKRRQEVKQELSTITSELNRLEADYQSATADIIRLKDIFRNKTGLRSWYYGGMRKWEKESNERQLSSQQLFASNMRAKIETLEKKYSRLIVELNDLNPKGFKIERN